jgi:hypothetical protein
MIKLAPALCSLCFATLAHPVLAQVSPAVIAREAAAIANQNNTNPQATAAAAAAAASALPLRNVQIEVRQVQQDSTERAGIEAANPRVEIDRNGQVNVGGQLQIQRRQSSQTSSARQYALVLNGNSTRIALGTSTPVRLVQTVVRNGVVVSTQTVGLLDSGTGFIATPRWNGSDRVALEISAQQTQATGSFGVNTNTVGSPQAGSFSRQVSGTSSTLVLPLDVWTTIAQSEQDTSGSSSSLGGGTSQSGRSGYDVQVRLTIK